MRTPDFDINRPARTGIPLCAIHWNTRMHATHNGNKILIHTHHTHLQHGEVAAAGCPAEHFILIVKRPAQFVHEHFQCVKLSVLRGVHTRKVVDKLPGCSKRKEK